VEQIGEDESALAKVRLKPNFFLPCHLPAKAEGNLAEAGFKFPAISNC
jgi:hypothetical protein